MKTKSMMLLVLASLLATLTFAQPNYPSKPEQATIVTSDLNHFIEAYQSLSEESDTIQVLQALYLDKASAGLKEYITRFNLTAKDLSNAIQKHPEDYQKILSFYKDISGWEHELISDLQKYKEILPDAVFPPTYLLVADHKGIANASKFGQLVSIEKKYPYDLDALKNTIIHELTHFQQAMSMGIEAYRSVYMKNDNMLDLILREGGAEFITYKLVRQNETQFKKLQNYEAEEAKLWGKFKLDLEKQDKDFWLNVSFDDNNKGNPIQMGYGLGYKIIASYYEQAEDKNKALYDILNIQDPAAFLAASNYSPE